ncbi:hypothetical protein ACWD2L_38630 [Streptomyces sp. NPDC002754]
MRDRSRRLGRDIADAVINHMANSSGIGTGGSSLTRWCRAIRREART